MWAAPDMGAHGCQRLTHTSNQPSRQHTHGLTGTPRPAQASPKQGNQGTWGLALHAARRRVAPGVWRRGRDAVHLHASHTGERSGNITYSHLDITKKKKGKHQCSSEVDVSRTWQKSEQIKTIFKKLHKFNPAHIFHSYYSGREMQGHIYIMYAVTVTLDVHIKTVFPPQRSKT